MSKKYIWHADEVAAFGGPNYESRLLLDSKMAGEPCINVNHGTIPPGKNTACIDDNGRAFGLAHEKAEIYIGMSGEGDVFLDGEKVVMRQGSLLYMPAGAEHFIVNRSTTEAFTILTLWPDEKDNEAWFGRKNAWGEDYYRRRSDGTLNEE
jgi:mannose-6-phosphate isomerase-like protein (cupin superfamily)